MMENRSPEFGESSPEQYQVREEARENERLYETANQTVNGAFTDPIGTLKWLLGFKK
jgi:hypothetical protein